MFQPKEKPPVVVLLYMIGMYRQTEISASILIVAILNVQRLMNVCCIDYLRQELQPFKVGVLLKLDNAMTISIQIKPIFQSGYYIFYPFVAWQTAKAVEGKDSRLQLLRLSVGEGLLIDREIAVSISVIHPLPIAQSLQGTAHPASLSIKRISSKMVRRLTSPTKLNDSNASLHFSIKSSIKYWRW